MSDLRPVLFNRGPVPFEWNGYRFTVGDVSAQGWLDCLTSLTSSVRFSTHLVDRKTSDQISELLENGTLKVSHLNKIRRTALKESTGRSWWEAERLLASLWHGRGEVFGFLLGKGIRIEDLNVAQLCAAVWVLLIENKDDKERFKLTSSISIPPPDADPDETDDWDDVSDFAQVAKAMQNMPGMSIG